jgi:hypothetical protein
MPLGTNRKRRLGFSIQYFRAVIPDQLGVHIFCAEHMSGPVSSRRGVVLLHVGGDRLMEPKVQTRRHRRWVLQLRQENFQGFVHAVQGNHPTWEDGRTLTREIQPYTNVRRGSSARLSIQWTDELLSAKDVRTR